MSVKKGLLCLPEDRELAQIPGFLPDGGTPEARFERRILHEWPLSCVELAVFPERPEIERIVKSQLAAASVEAAFYGKVGSPASRGLRLPKLLGHAEADGTDWLVLSCEEGEPEDWTGLTEREIRERVRGIGEVLQTPPFADAPVFTDWGTAERCAASVGEDLPVLADGGLSAEEENALRRWTESGMSVLWDEPVGLLHGDLKGDNLLRRGDGVALIDWQRPMRGPLALEEELSLLLEDRTPETNGPCAPLACLALSHWYAWAYRTCLPWPFVRGQAVRYARLCLARIGR